MWNYSTAYSPVEPASRMRLTLVTAPAVEPLTVGEARARLNIGSDVSDEVLCAFITSGSFANFDFRNLSVPSSGRL